MKLHLPKGLRKAVMACMAALTTLTTTVGTGIITGGAVTYMLAMPQVKAEWGVKDGILTFYDKDVDYTTTDDGKTLIVPTEGYDGGNYAEPHIAAEASPNSGAAGRTVYSITIAKDTKLVFTDSAWANDSKFFNGYTLQNLIIGNGKNSGALELREGNSTVIVESVSGTLTSVQNTIDKQGTAGKLILGKDGGTINISGTISSEGTTTLLGTINITDISNFSGHTAGYSDGANGFELYDGYAVFSGNVDATAATITLKGESVVLNDNSWIEADIEDGTVYYLNDGLKGSFSKAESGDANGAVIQGTAGGSLEIIGFKDADLTNKVQVNVNSTLVIGNGSDITDAVIQKGCDTLGLTINKGGKFTITKELSSAPYNGTITVNGGGTLLLNNIDTLGWGQWGGAAAYPNVINIGGGDDVAKIQMTHRTTMSSVINMKGNAVIENPEDATLDANPGLDGYQFTVTATGTNNLISCPIMGTASAEEKDVTIEVVEATDTLEITGKLYNRAGALDFIKQGDGKLLLSNADSEIDGLFTMESGITQVTKDLKLSGGLIMHATAGATIDGGATVTVSGGTITLKATNDFGEGTLAFEGNITLDLSAFTDFDPTVEGSTLTLGKVGALDVSGVSSLMLTTPIDTSLTPDIALDESGNIVLTIAQKALSWDVTDSSATLLTQGLSVTVNYKDGAYEAVYEGGTAVSTPVADGTGKIQVMPDGMVLTDSASITLESGTYAGVQFMQMNDTTKGVLGSATDQKKLTLNITGDASVSAFINGAQGLIGWGGGDTDVKLYTDIEYNVNTTGNVAALVMTGEANHNNKFSVYGDLTANIKAGTIGIIWNKDNDTLYDTDTRASIAAGSRGVIIKGDITYNLGEINGDNANLVFQGNIVGGIVRGLGQGAEGTSEGEITINLNSGTYENVYGAGIVSPHTGNVTINYNGGIINGLIKSSAGATVSGDKVLNMAASLDASKVDLSTFTAVNVLGESVLSVTTGGYAYDSQKVVFDSTATLFVNENGGVVCADQLVVGGNLTINGTVDVTGTVDAEGAKYSDNNTDGYLVSQKALVSAAGNLVIGDNAVFSFNGSAVEDYTVADGTITGSVTDKSVFYVNSADYVYSATKIDSASGIQIAETGSLVVNSTGNQLSAITGEGTLVVAPGTVATLADVIGTGNAIGCPVVEISGENTDLTIDNRLDDKVVIIDGATAQSGNAYFAKDVTLDNGAVLVADGQTELFDWGKNQKLSITNGSELQLGNVRISLEGEDELVLNNSKITGSGDANAAVDICKTAIKVSSQGASSISGPIRISKDQTATLNVIDGKLTVGEVKGRGNSYLSKTGAGVLELNGNLNELSGTTIQEGTLSLGASASFGATTVTINTGAILALGTSAMTMADATLALQNGSILSLAALSADTTPLTLKEVQLGGSVYIDAKAEDLVPGTYNIIAGTGLDISKFALYGAAAGKYSTIFSVDENNVLKMTLGLNDKALVWTGDTADNVWNDTAENTPWEKLDGTVSAFAEKNVVNFTTDTPVEERTVTIADMVAPAAAYVYGTDWEWTGDGAINCSGALTVGDGSETELTIANTGAKTFTGGVIVNEGATLVVENADGWTGKVSGAGTLELSTGTNMPQTGTKHWLVDRFGSTDGTFNTLKLSGNTIIDQQSTTNNAHLWLNAIDVLEVESGSCFAYNIEGPATYSVILKLAGNGGADNMGGALSVVSHANWIGDQTGNKTATLTFDGIELTDDASIYVGKGQNINTAKIKADITSNNHTLTKVGGGTLQLNKAFTDAFNLDIKAGTVYLNGGGDSGNEGACSGTGSATIASGATLQIEGKSANGSGIKLTSLTMADDSTLYLDHAPVEIDALAASGSVVLRHKRPAQADTMSISIHNVTGSGDIDLTRLNDTHSAVQEIVLDGANTFSGNWKLSMFNTLVASHLDALANATVELSCTDADKTATLHLAAETIKLKGLKGSKGEISLSGLTNHYLVINTDAAKSYEYSGDFGDGLGYLNLVKDGAGTQSFNGDLNAFSGDITVNAGTLNLGTAQTIAEGRSVSIAAGATLGTALTLNGGTLSLDTTGTSAASLGGYTLTMGKGTTLSLTIAGTEVTGTQITLLGGIGALNNVILGENGSLGLLGDSFTLGVITDKSLTADTPAVADAGAVDAWADRLGRSELFYDETSDALYLKLAANILAADPLYWDSADAAGNGSWLGNNWSEEDKLGVDPGVMQNPWQGDKPVSVVFNGDTAAEVTIDTDAVVTDLTVKNGGYTYVKDGETGTLTIEGKLTVEGTGTADISAMGAVEAGSLDVAGTLTADDLTVNGAAAVTGTATADELTITGAATVDGGTVGASSLSAAGVVISGEAAKVEAAQLKVGEGGLSMSAGTLNAGSLFSNDGVTAEAEITGGTVTIGGSTLSSTTVTGAEFVGNSTLAGAADKAVTVGNITVDGAGKLTLSDATLNGKITVEDGGTLEFGGTMHLDTTKCDFDYDATKTRYTATAAEDDTLDKGDGFKIENVVYTVVEGSLTNVDPQGSSWTVGTDAREGVYDKTTGKVTVSEPKDTTAYWVNDNVTLSLVSGEFVKEPTTTMKVTTTIKLNGGTLQMNEGTDLTIETNNEDTDDKESAIALQSGATLKSKQLIIADGTKVTLTGLTGTTLDLGTEAGVDATKLEGLDAATWQGKVTTAATEITDVAALGNAASEVELTGDVNSGDIALGAVGTVHATKSLTAESISGTGALEVDGLATLTKGTSSLGNAAFDGGLVLGGDEAADLTGSDLTAASVELTKGSIEAKTLTVGAGITLGKDSKVDVETLEANGAISLEAGSSIEAGSLTLGEEASIEFKKIGEAPVVSVDSLTADTLQVLIDNKLMADAADAQTDKAQPIATIMEVTEPSANMPEITLNGGSNVINPPGEKYGYTLDWNDTLLQLMATANQNYMKEKFNGASANAKAGATIMDEAFASGATNADGDLKKILAAVDNGAMTEEGLASVAGSSTAALGMAFAGDVERQLRAIRNRTTTMGVNQCVVNEGMPYFNAWVNAEGNMGELDKDGTYAGYKLDSWGGTVGFDVDVNPNLTLGLAVTAMYGDLTVDGPDMLDGDMDTYYVTAFARYSKRAWTHTFIGTVGKMDGSYERTVTHAGGSYTAEGDTDGMAFGLMYEVGRVYALTEDGNTCLQPVFNVAYRHTTVNGYTEKGGNAALDVDDQTLDTITLGAGARMQAVVGENLYNRTSVLELRALAKLDVGDRASEADVAFIGGGSRATVESAELGAFGVELGAGLSIPVGDENDGTIFFDVSAELRSGYSNVNGTVGYRINF